MADKTTFERIYNREIPVYEIYRNDTHGVLAFLDAFPVTKGHLLVIPKEPIDSYVELSMERAMQLQAATLLLSQHLTKVLKPFRVAVLVSGYGVPHVHVHAIPSYERSDIARVFDFERLEPANRAPDAELTETQRLLQLPAEVQQALDDALAAAVQK